MRNKALLLLLAFATFSFAQDSIPNKELSALNFRNIGPAGMSGRITAIEVDPRDKNSIYGGSASGGLWHSSNGGTSWNCIFNNEAVSSIGALALDPNNPDIIWAGTGEGNPRNSNTGGAGIYLSRNGGKTWQLMGLEKSRHIHRIIVHPHNSDIVYVAAIGNPWADSETRGVYKTSNGGKSWERILYNNERTGAAEMVMDPLNPEKLIVNMWEHRREPWFFKSGGKGSGLYITYDGGDTWQKKTDKHGLPKGSLGRMGIAIAASQPSRVYALVEKKGKNALYRSDDGGEKWSMISQEDNIGNRPFYYSEIYVDPQNENRVYSIWSVISRSEDGGKTWKVIAPYSYIHPDHHAFYIHPKDPNYIINGNDGGMNISRDRGRSWRFVNNLPLAQFYHINYDMETPYNVYGGMQDNGSWKGPAYVWKVDGIRNDYWQELYFGDGFDVSIDPDNSRYVYAMSQEGYVGRVDTKTGYTKMIRPVHPENETLRFNWNAPIAQDPFDNSTIYFGAQYVFKSTDKGSSWEVISPDLTTNDSTKQNFGESGGLTFDVTGAENYTTLLCIEPGDKKDELWVSSDDGRLHFTKNGGANWTDLSAKLKDMPKGAWIPQIVNSKHKDGAAFVVANDYRRGNEKAMLYYTDNYGKSFKNIGMKLPAYVLSVVQDPEMENLLFAGTQRGLFFSWNFGKSWQKWSKEFPTVPVSDLKIHPREHDLIVGTFGRSAYVLDELEHLRELIKMHGAESMPKFKVLDPGNYYSFAYKRADGSRFPADGIFKGENRSSRPSLYIYNGFEKGDSVKATKIKFELFRGDELLSTNYQKAKKGFETYYLSLRAKGIGFPSQNRKLNDTTERAVLSLPIGSYRLDVSYGGQKESLNIDYKMDPRLENEVQSEKLAELYAWNKELDASLAAINEAVKWMKMAKAEIKLAQGIADLKLDIKKAKAFKDSIKALSKALSKFEERIYGKKVDGYYDQPNTLQSQFYAMSSYGRSYNGVPSQSPILLKKYRASEAEFLADLEKFQKEDWPSFSENIEAFSLRL